MPANRYYDTVFLIDDSGSVRHLASSPMRCLETHIYAVQMSEGSPTKWQQCTQAVIEIADKAIDNDTDGIDIYFLNSDTIFRMKDEIRGITVRISCDKLLPTS
jgi:hypothetical protein